MIVFKDGFAWQEVSAEEARKAFKQVFIIHDDESETLIEDLQTLERAIAENWTLATEIGHLTQQQRLFALIEADRAKAKEEESAKAKAKAHLETLKDLILKYLSKQMPILPWAVHFSREQYSDVFFIDYKTKSYKERFTGTHEEANIFIGYILELDRGNLGITLRAYKTKKYRPKEFEFGEFVKIEDFGELFEKYEREFKDILEKDCRL